MHRTHDDRYLLPTGEMKVVFYDGRADSTTHGLVSDVVLSEQTYQLLSIPAGVWHANHNIGSCDCLGLNFPTQPYNHENPDKYRLAGFQRGDGPVVYQLAEVRQAATVVEGVQQIPVESIRA